MAIPKSPTGAWPATDVHLTMLVDPAAMPATSASASVIHGGESLFARLEVLDMPTSRPRHGATFALIGPRAAVLDVLGQLAAAVDAAQVEPEPEQ